MSATRAEFLASVGSLVFVIAAAPRSESNPLGTKTYPNVGSWLALEPDGSVTIFYGKVEQGTGIQTAIAQLVADELDVAFEHIHVIQGDTDLTPDQGYTAGSASLSVGSVPIRHAAAQARATLIVMAAARLKVAPGTLATRDGAVVSTTDATVHVPYGELVSAGRFPGTIGNDVQLKSPASYRVVGKPVPRVDIPTKLNGSFRYVQNVRLPGMVHARMIHPQRLGQIALRVDVASLGELQSKVQVVHREGFVAVAATREWDAVSAAATLKVEWSDTVNLSSDEQIGQVLRTTLGTERTLLETANVFAPAGARELRATYVWPFQSHGSIGPSCGVADVRPNHITIWSGSEGTNFLRRSIAALLRRPESDIVVKYVEASGAYGHNGADDAAAAAALVSAAIGKPVRMQWMRVDETRWDPKGPAMLMDLAASLDASGHVVAWSFHGYSPTHQGRPDGTPGSLLAGRLLGEALQTAPFVGGDRNAPTNYAFTNQRVVITDLQSAALRQSALRGLGGTANTFANESFVDELAHTANANPIDFRLAYLSDDPRARAVLEAVRPAFRPGRGVAFVRYENNAAYVAAVVDLRVDHKSGHVKLNHVWVAHDCGLIVNPNGLRNQIEGNVIQAASRALVEEVRFSADGVTSRDWETYPILRFSDVPQIDVTLLDQPDQPILGAGEATTTVIAPAIANAIFAQTGARLRDVPLTPARVKAALTGIGR
ncbi:MAG: molybdopterin cofactor-binding domain-containing protein [Candidatus Aquilonibacter sp.]